MDREFLRITLKIGCSAIFRVSQQKISKTVLILLRYFERDTHPDAWLKRPAYHSI